MVDKESMYFALSLTFVGAIGTALGGLAVVIQPKMSFKRLGVLQGFAAGLMLCISVIDLLPAGVEDVGFLMANIWFHGGVVFFAIVVAFIPEPSITGLDDSEQKNSSAKRAASSKRDPKTAKILMSGLVTAIGLALHNFPEGVAVYLASAKSKAVGLSLAVAIALHNVPEGVAVALPVYFATGSRWQGFKMAFLSGLSEPLGVVLLALFFPGLSKTWVDSMLAGVAGIMAFLALHELLPLAMEHAGKRAAVMALFVGMAVMSFNLHVLSLWIPPELH